MFVSLQLQLPQNVCGELFFSLSLAPLWEVDLQRPWSSTVMHSALASALQQSATSSSHALWSHLVADSVPTQVSLGRWQPHLVLNCIFDKLAINQSVFFFWISPRSTFKWSLFGSQSFSSCSQSCSSSVVWRYHGTLSVYFL